MDSMVQLFTTQFKDSIDIALQQEDSRIAATFKNDPFEGEKASPVDILDSVEVNEITSRYTPIARGEQNYTRRWIVPRSFSKAVYVDSFDALKSVKDPKSNIVESVRAAFERKKDDLSCEAMWASALTGKDGTTTTTWASEGANQIVLQTVGASAATGLNVAKLRAARKILMANNVNFGRERVYLGVNAEGYDDLFDEAMVVSREYNEPMVLKEGRIERFMGFEFVHSELFDTDGTYRRLPVWTEKAMQFGNWGSMNVDISQDKTLEGYPWRVYAYNTIGATRRDPKRMVEIKIAE